MKKVLLFALTLVTLASCKKDKNQGSSASVPVGENYAALNIRTTDQVVKVSTAANVLNMVYNEDVTLILDSAKLGGSWAVHLKEDFTGTRLAAYDYHSLSKYGVNATNWVDDNLNNIVLRSSKDTLIAGRMFVKKRITRSFIYQKSYASAADAAGVMDQLLQQTDIIAFNAWFTPAEPDEAKTANTAKLIYVKL